MPRRNPLAWYVDAKKNTISVHDTGKEPKVYRIGIDVLGQRANSCTVPASFFQDVLDEIAKPDDTPDAA